jgi:hypothetical protein
MTEVLSRAPRAFERASVPSAQEPKLMPFYMTTLAVTAVVILVPLMTRPAVGGDNPDNQSVAAAADVVFDNIENYRIVVAPACAISKEEKTAISVEGYLSTLRNSAVITTAGGKRPLHPSAIAKFPIDGNEQSWKGVVFVRNVAATDEPCSDEVVGNIMKMASQPFDGVPGM